MDRAELLAEGYEGTPEVAEVETVGIEGALPDTEEPVEIPEDVPQLPEEKEEAPVFDATAFQSTLDSIQSKMEGLDAISERLTQSEKRIGGITNKMRDVAEATQKAKDDAPTPEQIEAAATNKAERDALAEEWPEWSKELGKVEEEIAANRAEFKKSIPDANQIQETVVGSVEEKIQEMEVKLNHRFIELSHKGWTDTVKTPEFHDWMGKQPEDVQALGASVDPLDAISMLTQFEDSKGPNKVEEKIAANKDRLDRAVQTKRVGAQTKSKGWGDMTPGQQRKQLLKQGYDK